MTRIKMLMIALVLLMGTTAMAQSDGHNESAAPVPGGTSTPPPAGYTRTNTRTDEVPAGAAAVTDPAPVANPEDYGSTRLHHNPKGFKEPRKHPTKAGSARRATAPERKQELGNAPAKISTEDGK